MKTSKSLTPIHLIHSIRLARTKKLKTVRTCRVPLGYYVNERVVKIFGVVAE